MTVTNGDYVLMRETFAKLTALGDGPFRLATDVANIAKDKRKRYSSDLDGAPAVLPAGSSWVLSRYAQSWEFWSKKLDTRIRFQIREEDGIGIAWHGPDDHSKAAKVARAMLDAIQPAAKTIDSVRASIEQSALSSVHGWDILIKLHERGKISLDDIEAAAAAVDEDDSAPLSKLHAPGGPS